MRSALEHKAARAGQVQCCPTAVLLGCSTAALLGCATAVLLWDLELVWRMPLWGMWLPALGLRKGTCFSAEGWALGASLTPCSSARGQH